MVRSVIRIGDAIRTNSASEIGIHEVSVARSARMPTPTVSCKAPARATLLFTKKVKMSDAKNKMNKTADQIGTQDRTVYHIFFFTLKSSPFLFIKIISYFLLYHNVAFFSIVLSVFHFLIQNIRIKQTPLFFDSKYAIL